MGGGLTAEERAWEWLPLLIVPGHPDPGPAYVAHKRLGRVKD